MKVRTRTGSAALGLASLMLVACGGIANSGGSGAADTGAGSGPGGGGTGSGAIAAQINSWDACEVLGQFVYDFVEHVGYVGFRQGPFSANWGAGTPSDLVACTGTATYSEDPEYASLNEAGLFTFAVAAKPTEEEAEQRYRELLALRDELYRSDRAEMFVESEVPGSWDASTYYHGDYGMGPAYAVLALDGQVLIVVYVETGASSRPNREWDFDAIGQFLLSETVPGIHQTVQNRLDAAG